MKLHLQNYRSYGISRGNLRFPIALGNGKYGVDCDRLYGRYSVDYGIDSSVNYRVGVDNRSILGSCRVDFRVGIWQSGQGARLGAGGGCWGMLAQVLGRCWAKCWSSTGQVLHGCRVKCWECAAGVLDQVLRDGRGAQ